MAIGAERADILRLVLRDGLRRILPGVALGIVGSLLLTRLLTTQLYGVSPTDPPMFAAVTVFLLAVAFTASWMPARRAAGLEPIETLRQE